MTSTVKIPKFYEDECFCFPSRFLIIFNFMKKRQNLTHATLREVWLWHLMLKIYEITGKIGFQFSKLTFLGARDHTICKFA